MAIAFKHPKKLFLLDQDGTLYKGNTLFSGTKSFLRAIKASGAAYLFITNNSSKTNDEYVEKLAKFDINATLIDFYTSTDATINYLKTHHRNDYVYLVGTKKMQAHFKSAGIKLSSDPAKVTVALLSYDTELTYEKLETIVKLLRNPGITYLATNPDLVCPNEDGYLPDCGSFAHMIFNATGRSPMYLGKPARLFVETILEKYNITVDDVVIVGDRLYTDIALGSNAGIETILVLSGEATLADVNNSSVTPTFIVSSISEIF